MPLLPELVPVKDGLNYKHGAPAGAFACFIPPQAQFGLPPSFGPLPAALRLDPAGLRMQPVKDSIANTGTLVLNSVCYASHRGTARSSGPSVGRNPGCGRTPRP